MKVFNIYIFNINTFLVNKLLNIGIFEDETLSSTSFVLETKAYEGI